MSYSTSEDRKTPCSNRSTSADPSPLDWIALHLHPIPSFQPFIKTLHHSSQPFIPTFHTNHSSLPFIPTLHPIPPLKPLTQPFIPTPHPNTPMSNPTNHHPNNSSHPFIPTLHSNPSSQHIPQLPNLKMSLKPYLRSLNSSLTNITLAKFTFTDASLLVAYHMFS